MNSFLVFWLTNNTVSTVYVAKRENTVHNTAIAPWNTIWTVWHGPKVSCVARHEYLGALFCHFTLGGEGCLIFFFLSDWRHVHRLFFEKKWWYLTTTHKDWFSRSWAKPLKENPYNIKFKTCQKTLTNTIVIILLIFLAIYKLDRAVYCCGVTAKEIP